MVVEQKVLVDLEHLIGVVQDAFYESEKFHKTAAKKAAVATHK